MQHTELNARLGTEHQIGTMTDFFGIPEDDETLLIETPFKGSGPRLLFDCTDHNGLVGIRSVNFNIAPPDATIHLLTLHPSLISDPDRIREIAQMYDGIVMTGGQHPHPDTIPNPEILHRTAGNYHGFSRRRDIQNIGMQRAAIELGLRRVNYCRNEQLRGVIAGLPLQEARDHHAPQDGGTEPIMHKARTIADEHRAIPGLKNIRRVNTFHSLAFKIGDVDPEKLYDEHRLYIHTIDGTDGVVLPETEIELMVGVDASGNPIEYDFQWHPERQPGKDGETARAFIHSFLTQRSSNFYVAA